MEWNDIYDRNRNLTGQRHLRGTPWKPGEYCLVVCVWIYDGKGNLLLTRRAPEKSFPGTWENTGGAALAGEDSLTAITRELFEETGIRANKEDFEYIGSNLDRNVFLDYYCLKTDIPAHRVVLQPGETDGVMWADAPTIHKMIADGRICSIIGNQYLRQEADIQKRQTAQ